jgi:hypothetical protein
LLARAKLGLTAETADERLNGLPFVMESGLTRGQAEDLLWQLGRERIACRCVRRTNPI